MSQSFSFSRFGRLFSKHTAEHGGGYLLATAVLVGGLALLMGFVAYTSTSPITTDMQSIMFVLGLLAAGSFFTSTVFALFGDKKQATAALMLPASHWEKYLVGWLYTLPIFLTVYIGCFFLVDSLVLQLDSHMGPPPPLVQLFAGKEQLYTSLVAYAVVNAVFLWGSIFFAKQHFVRTAFALLLGEVVLSLLNMQAVKSLMGRDVSGVIPFAGMSFQEGKEWKFVNLTPEQNGLFLVVLLGGLLLLGWAGAYQRLTEKEV